MKQKIVLHVVDHMGVGGAQSIISELLRKWNNENIKIFCYALRTSNNDLKYKNNPDLFISKYKYKYSIFSFFELKRFIETKGIGILHLHLKKSIVFGILLKMFYFKNIKLIIHEHGEIYLNNFWYNSFLKLFQGKIDLLIGVSEATKRKLIDIAKISEKKITILYNFVDLEHFHSQKIEISRLEEREKLGLNDDDFILGFAGRHVERKGCRDLIFALKNLEQFENIKLFIAGDGPKKEEYKDLANKLELDHNIFFLGFVPDIKWLYSIIDCFVIPSHWEALGIVALEAQAMGIPVIATNVEGLNEVVLDDETGLLFEPKNEKDLAEKIELLYNDKGLRIELIKNGLYEVRKYSLDNYLLILENIYENH